MRDTVIGSSIAQLIGAPSDSTATTSSKESPLQQSDSPVASTHGGNEPDLPCLLRTAGSHRIVLQGPRKSGRTSMAMNLAHTCAADHSRTHMNAPCHCLVQPCQCTPVIFYRPSSKSPQTANYKQLTSLRYENEEIFPMACRYIEDHEEWLKHRREPSTMPIEDVSEWDPDVLRRIRIKYVNSAHDILQDLLSILGRPIHEQPSGAIVIDDLDEIVMCPSLSQAANRNDAGFHHQTHPSISSENSMTEMMQALAVAVDTSHALQRIHGRLPIVLATTLETAKLVSPWMETFVSLTCTSDNPTRVAEKQARQASGWRAQMQIAYRADFKQATEGQFHSLDSNVEYTLSIHPFLGGSLEWTRRRSSD